MRIIVTIQIIPEDLAAHLALLQVEIVICHLTFDVPGIWSDRLVQQW